MSPARSTALLALAAAWFTLQACEDAERDPPPAEPTGGATGPGASGGTAGTGGRGGAPGGQGGAPGGQGGAPGTTGGSGPAPGAPNVATCPPNAAGTPCSGGGGLPAVCVQPSDGGPVSGCVCLQMTWTCGSLPGGGGGGGGGGLPDAGALVPPMTSPCPPNAANETCPAVGTVCARAGDAGAAGYCACFPNGMGTLGWRCAGQP